MADDELQSSRQFAKTQKPRDAATLIIVRRDKGASRVLLGKRHGGHAFMPDKYVFPGGKLDPSDGRMKTAHGLDSAIEEKLLKRMRGRSSLTRARGLAFAAIRETFEEVGLIVGRQAHGAISAPSTEWQAFLDTGYAPDLSPLRLVMRAITPPGRTRRFDARFFVVDAGAVANLEKPVHNGSGELLETRWFTFAETRDVELPLITQDVLRRLSPLIDSGGWPQPDDPVVFQYHRRGQWQLDQL